MPQGRKRLEGAMRDLLGGKQDKPRLFPGALGAYVDGVKQLKVQGRPDFVYVRLRGATSEVIHAFNDAVGLHWDLPVLVYRDPLAKHLWRIYARDIGQYQDWGGASYLPPHGLSHSFVGGTGGGSDVVWVQKRQFMPLLGRPDTSGSMSVWVEPDYYYWDDLYHYWPGSGTSSLMGSKPTGSQNGRFVTIYLDGDAGILRTLNGPEFNIVYPPADPSLYIQAVTGTMGIPIVAAFLTTGTERLGWGELYDLREVVSPPHAPFPVSGVSGSVVVQDEGVVKGSVPTLDFVGAGVTAAVAGGKATITIPGESALPHTGTVVVEDEGIIQGSAPILDFVGAGVTAAVAAGKATITIPGGIGTIPCTGTVVLLDEGFIQGSVTELDFIGEGVVAATVGLRGEVVINPMMILNEMAPQGYATVMDFQGAGVDAVVAAGQATVTIPGGGGFLPSTGTVVVEDEGIIQGSAPILDFVGAGVTAAVAGGKATVTIPGGSGTIPCTGTFVALERGAVVGSYPELDVAQGIDLSVSGTRVLLEHACWEATIPKLGTGTAGSAGGVPTRMYLMAPQNATVRSILEPGAKILFAVPVQIGSCVAVEEIAWRPDYTMATGTWRLGIYNNTSFNFPGNLMFDSGLRVGTVSQVIQFGKLRPLTLLDPGTYWLAFWKGTAGNMFVVKDSSPGFLGYDSTFGGPYAFVQVTFSSGTPFPDVFPPSGTYGLVSTIRPMIGLGLMEP